MKRTYPVTLTLSVLFLFLLACTRIDTTELGDDLIPVVDNVNTFDTTLVVESDNLLLTDTTRTLIDDNMAVGYISSDPEFGRTTADMYFNLSAPQYGAYPFINRDSVKIDSVVLSLAFTGAYGDTVTPQTFRVFEIGNNADFKDSAYRIIRPDFAPLGSELGSRTVVFKDLNDSVRLSRAPDTPATINVMRIRIDTALGRRFVGFDTTNTATGGFRNDSIFRTLFRGFAIKADRTTGNGLAYFNLSDVKSRLIVYFRATKNGKTDTTYTHFAHTATGQANLIQRTPAGNYATYLSNGGTNDDRLFIQSTPGSYGLLRIPGLSTLNNIVVHRAELIATRLASPGDNTFGPPGLFLDMVNQNMDTAFTIQNDFLLTGNGANFSVFGGNLRSDNTYRFNISRHVQGIVTRKEPNFALRLYAPFVTRPFYLPPGKLSDYPSNTLGRAPIQLTEFAGAGRVVLHGGSAPDPTKKLRLYIIYSKI